MKSYLESKNLTAGDWSELELLLIPKRLKNKEYLIQENSVSKELVWIQKGMLRSFYYNDKSEEITYCITFENSLMTALSSFISGSPSQENIQAIGDVELLSISKENVQHLCEESLKWTVFFKSLVEEQFIELENKLFNIQRHDAKKRYQKLITEFPIYVQHIPVQYLASYLNITARHLSRIRKEITL